MKQIIIDCDPGHDDAVAIFMALAHKDKLDLKAVTTVCGNNILDKVTNNAHYVLSTARAKTMVAKGADAPLINAPIISAEFHGDSGMDGPTLEVERTSIEADCSAVEAMVKILKEAEGKVTLVPLAPLTNIALLIKAYPELVAKIDSIVLMGGGIEHGNITEHAEFNIYVDPEAAQIVYSSGISIVMCGLDVTEQVEIQAQEYEYLRTKGRVGQVFCELMDFYIKGGTAFGATGCVMHDPCAMAYLINPELFTGKKANVSIELIGVKRGKTVADYESDKANTLVVVAAEAKEVGKVILDSIEKLAEEVGN